MLFWPKTPASLASLLLFNVDRQTDRVKLDTRQLVMVVGGSEMDAKYMLNLYVLRGMFCVCARVAKLDT